MADKQFKFYRDVRYHCADCVFGSLCRMYNVCYFHNKMNKAILVGYLCDDPKYKVLEGGGEAATFSLATNKKGQRLQNGDRAPDQVEYHNIVMWGRFAKLAKDYMNKGSKVFIEGEIRTRNYTGMMV